MTKVFVLRLGSERTGVLILLKNYHLLSPQVEGDDTLIVIFSSNLCYLVLIGEINISAGKKVAVIR